MPTTQLLACDCTLRATSTVMGRFQPNVSQASYTQRKHLTLHTMCAMRLAGNGPLLFD